MKILLMQQIAHILKELKNRWIKKYCRKIKLSELKVKKYSSHVQLGELESLLELFLLNLSILGFILAVFLVLHFKSQINI